MNDKYQICSRCGWENFIDEGPSVECDDCGASLTDAKILTESEVVDQLFKISHVVRRYFATSLRAMGIRSSSARCIESAANFATRSNTND
jgi:hypothetical protein